MVGDLTAAIDDLNATHEYTYALSGADKDSFDVVNGQLKLKDSDWDPGQSFRMKLT